MLFTVNRVVSTWISTVSAPSPPHIYPLHEQVYTIILSVRNGAEFVCYLLTLDPNYSLSLTHSPLSLSLSHTHTHSPLSLSLSLSCILAWMSVYLCIQCRNVLLLLSLHSLLFVINAINTQIQIADGESVKTVSTKVIFQY